MNTAENYSHYPSGDFPARNSACAERIASEALRAFQHEARQGENTSRHEFIAGRITAFEGSNPAGQNPWQTEKEVQTENSRLSRTP